MMVKLMKMPNPIPVLKIPTTALHELKMPLIIITSIAEYSFFSMGFKFKCRVVDFGITKLADFSPCCIAPKAYCKTFGFKVLRRSISAIL